MMKNHTKEIFAILCLLGAMLFHTNCRRPTGDNSVAMGDTITMKYASLLTIVKYDGYTTVSIANPWKEGTSLHQYVLVDKTKDLPASLPEGTVVRIPIEKAVVFTASHSQLMEWLHAEKQLAGVADLKYMSLPWVHEGVKQGVIADCGDGMNPVIEKIIDLQPDLMMLSPFENSGGYGQLEDIHIPLMECADYMETSALGRAEWMKLYGMLFGKEQEADSLFNVVLESYNGLKTRAQEMPKGRSIITEKLTGSTWYVAGGKSTVGQLIADANGTYAWADDPHGGSLSMTFETVLDKAGDSDVWIFNHFGSGRLTYARLAAEYPGYKQMKAFKEHNTWYVDTQKVKYFEEVPFRPDFLLRDYLCLLHPEMGLGQPKYYTSVED